MEEHRASHGTVSWVWWCQLHTDCACIGAEAFVLIAVLVVFLAGSRLSRVSMPGVGMTDMSHVDYSQTS